MYMIRPTLMRPRVVVHAKKDDFIPPTEAPGEGSRRFPSMDQGPEKEVHPIKKFIMKVFKIEEIDHEKFRENNKWAIKPQSRPRE